MEKLAREPGGIGAKAIASRPELLDEHVWYWKAFWTLSGSRPIAVGFSGSAPLPIPISEYESFCRLYDVTGDDRDALVEVVRSLDAEYLKAQIKD